MTLEHAPPPGGRVSSRDLIARLALDSGPAPLARDPDGTDRLVTDLRRAMIPLADVDETRHPDLEWLFRTDAYQRLREEHIVRRNAYRVEFEAFLVDAARAGIPVIVMKASDVFPYESSNLDLLIPPHLLDEAGRILVSRGFLHLTHYVEPHKTLFKKFRRSHDLAVFHLHAEASWDGAVFLDRDAMWSRRRPLEALPGAEQLHPGHLAAHTVAHGVYENARFGPVDLRRLIRALAIDPDAAAAALEQAALHGWLPGLRLGVGALARLERSECGTDRVARCFRTGFEAGPGRSASGRHDLGRTRCRGLMALKILSSPAVSPWGRVVGLWAYLAAKGRALIRRPRHRSHVVAFSGVDGAGKSLYAQRVLDFLNRCDIRASILWARGGSTGAMLVLKSLLRRAAGSSGALKPRPEGEVMASRWQRALWPWAVALELLLTWTLRLTGRRILRSVTLLDRHVLDATVDLTERLGEDDPRALKSWRILSHLAPAPDLHFLFDVRPEVALTRKDSGMDQGQLERRRALFLRFAPAGIRIIDTERDPDVVTEEIGIRIVQGVLRWPR